MTSASSSEKQFLEILAIIRAEGRDQQLLPNYERTLSFCPRRHSRPLRSAAGKLKQIKDAVKLQWRLFLQHHFCDGITSQGPIASWHRQTFTFCKSCLLCSTVILVVFKTQIIKDWSEASNYDRISQHCIWHNLGWRCWKPQAAFSIANSNSFMLFLRHRVPPWHSFSRSIG